MAAPANECWGRLFYLAPPCRSLEGFLYLLSEPLQIGVHLRKGHLYLRQIAKGRFPLPPAVTAISTKGPCIGAGFVLIPFRLFRFAEAWACVSTVKACTHQLGIRGTGKRFIPSKLFAMSRAKRRAHGGETQNSRSADGLIGSAGDIASGSKSCAGRDGRFARRLCRDLRIPHCDNRSGGR